MLRSGTPSLDDTQRKELTAATFREKLEQHRTDPKCANCHAKMDAFGLTLENFDGIALWRTLDEGQAIDPTSQVFDGTKIARIEKNPKRIDYDLGDRTLMPGGIDTHVHIGWHFDKDGRSHDDETDRGESAEESALYAAENAYATLMGGITTDLDGRATLPGLYAVGECSCTGMHGANRLASNSLTECFVFGARAARAAAQEPGPADTISSPDSSPRLPLPSAQSRAALWQYAGLERDGAGLRHLLSDPHPLVRLIGRSALTREESRGAHVRRDFPILDPALDGRHVMVSAGAEPTLSEWR